MYFVLCFHPWVQELTIFLIPPGLENRKRLRVSHMFCLVYQKYRINHCMCGLKVYFVLERGGARKIKLSKYQLPKVKTIHFRYWKCSGKEDEDWILGSGAERWLGGRERHPNTRDQAQRGRLRDREGMSTSALKDTWLAGSNVSPFGVLDYAQCWPLLPLEWLDVDHTVFCSLCSMYDHCLSKTTCYVIFSCL